MKSWAHPDLPLLPGVGEPPVLHDARGEAIRVDSGPRTGLYVCGITPYDATHLGHAATYVTFDLVGRVLRDAGHEVDYVQNVTDIDDPLIERAARDGIDWRDLAAREIQLFRDDMEALRVVPPRAYVGVVERIPQIAGAVRALLDGGAAYLLEAQDAVVSAPNGGVASDVYLDLARRDTFGSVSGWTRAEMFEVFADRGGDPDRAGKRDPLDPLLWRATRAGEPSWEVDGLCPGRPGWHIECTCIAIDDLGVGFDIQGGGIDLVFPHHEMSAVQAEAWRGPGSFARAYVHQEMVGLDGHKMSKSRGNLVLVSRLRRQGVDPMAVRLVLLAEHYRTPWEWTDDKLDEVTTRLQAWRAGAPHVGAAAAESLLADVRAHLADDLDTAGALRRVDAVIAAASAGPTTSAGSHSGSNGSGARLLADTLDALLGIRL